jgi:hypothetical protein
MDRASQLISIHGYDDAGGKWTGGMGPASDSANLFAKKELGDKQCVFVCLFCKSFMRPPTQDLRMHDSRPRCFAIHVCETVP